ncbi:MAG: GerMN domain-containing protein [Fimbriimonadales bacterium]
MNEARRVQGLLGVLFVVIAGIAIGVGVWLRLSPTPMPPSPTMPPSVQVYVPKVDSRGELTYEPKTVAVGERGYQGVFEQLIREAPVFPQGTRLLKAERDGDTLVLDFSTELVDGFSGGSDDEAALINALTRTAGGFPEIKRIRLLVEGKPIESIGGHIDTTQPLTVSSSR